MPEPEHQDTQRTLLSGRSRELNCLHGALSPRFPDYIHFPVLKQATVFAL